MDASGPYYGTSKHSGEGAKLFIENAWGSLWEYIDDSYWSNGFYAGQNLRPGLHTTNKTITTVTSGLNGSGTYPYSIKIDSWGLPTAVVRENSPSAPDYFVSNGTGDVMVGGYWNLGDPAGLSYMFYSDGQADKIRGTRLVFLLASDPMAKMSVKYMDDGSQLKSDSVQKGQEYTISNLMPVKEGSTFMEWSDGTDVYHSGDKFIVMRNTTLTSVWGHTVTFDLKGGTWDRSDTVATKEGTYTVPSAVPTKSGCTFKEWRCGNDSVLPGGIIDLNSEVTLQAVWTSNIIPVIPDGTDPEDQGAVVPIVVEEEHGTWLQKNGKSILIIAVIVAIIAELAVLCISRRR